MNEAATVPVSTVTLYALWSLVFVALLTSWILMAVGHDSIGHAFGFTACVSTGISTAATSRAYTSRVCRLMRVLNGIDGSQGAELHRVP